MNHDDYWKLVEFNWQVLCSNMNWYVTFDSHHTIFITNVNKAMLIPPQPNRKREFLYVVRAEALIPVCCANISFNVNKVNQKTQR